MQRFKYAIVGFGPAGIFTFALLPTDVLSDTLVIDPTCLGGDLATSYGGIMANITKADIVHAFKKIPRWSNNEFALLKQYADTDCPKLEDVCKQMRACIQPDLLLAHVHTSYVTELVQVNDGWQLRSANTTWEAEKVIICTGAKPKVMDLPIPSIPLPIALCKERLKQYVTPSSNIVVFGTAHSGTLVLKNLNELGCKYVTGIYKGEKAFTYARDGDLHGIKQESAHIADEIVGNAWGDCTPNLISYKEFSTVYRHVHSASLAIYSIGFEPVYPKCTGLDGSLLVLTHNAETGEFVGLPNLWGFGIAFPTSDVGFNGFITAIQSSSLSCVPDPTRVDATP